MYLFTIVPEYKGHGASEGNMSLFKHWTFNKVLGPI